MIRIRTYYHLLHITSIYVVVTVQTQYNLHFTCLFHATIRMLSYLGCMLYAK